MGLTYLKDKPEGTSFSYAYVEDADGNLVKVSLDNIKSLLGVKYEDIEITLLANNWTISEDESYYYQPIEILNSTANSRIDLQATPSQIIQLMNEEITIFVANNDGDIVAYSINGTPSTDMTISARITEVV